MSRSAYRSRSLLPQVPPPLFRNGAVSRYARGVFWEFWAPRQGMRVELGAELRLSGGLRRERL